MKLTDLKAKLTGMKSNAVRILAAATLAGAVLVVAPAAEAQHVVVRFGGPRVFVPAPPIRVYGGPVFAPEYPVYVHRDRDWRFRHDRFRDYRR